MGRKKNVNGILCKRIYNLNEQYFEKIDSEEKAYFLGFLYADGYNAPLKHTIRITLAEQDIDIIRKFKFALGFDGPIKIRKYKSNFKNNQPSAILDLNSKTLSKNLSDLGCTQKKSLNLIFPNDKQVSKLYIKDFIRGYYDGDGSFSLYYSYSQKYKNKHLKCCAEVISTKEFCDVLSKILKKELDINSYIVKATKTNVNCYRLKTSGSGQVYKLINWLYNNNTISLNRKYHKYLKIKKVLQETGRI